MTNENRERKNAIQANFKCKLLHLIDLHNYKNSSHFIIEFAGKYDVSEETVRGWIYRNKLPDTMFAIYLCDFFNCDLEYLLGNQEEIKRVDSDITKRLGLSQEAIVNIEQMDEKEHITLEATVNSLAIPIFAVILDDYFMSIGKKLSYGGVPVPDDRCDAYKKMLLADNMQKIFDELKMSRDIFNYFMRDAELRRNDSYWESALNNTTGTAQIRAREHYEKRKSEIMRIDFYKKYVENGKR